MRRQVLDERGAKRLSQLCSMRVERHFYTVVISLHGEFDHGCERPFREELGSALDEAKALVLDLHALEFIDSPGLRMLLAMDRTARDGGLEFTVLCGTGGVRRILRETGLDGLLPIVDDAGAVPASDSPV
jgi:anti-anti-sigma factor